MRALAALIVLGIVVAYVWPWFTVRVAEPKSFRPKRVRGGEG